LEPAFLQSRTIDALLAGEVGVALRRAEIDYPLRARLAQLQLVTHHAAEVWDPRQAHSRMLAPTPTDFITLSREPARRSQQLKAFIHQEPP
jgi:hypothetical protein